MIPLENQEIESNARDMSGQNQNDFSQNNPVTDAELTMPGIQHKMPQGQPQLSWKTVAKIVFLAFLAFIVASGIILFAMNGSIKINIEYNAAQNPKDEGILKQNKFTTSAGQTKQQAKVQNPKNPIVQNIPIKSERISLQSQLKTNEISNNKNVIDVKKTEQKIKQNIQQNKPQVIPQIQEVNNNQVIAPVQPIQTRTKEQRVPLQIPPMQYNTGQSHPSKSEHKHRPNTYDRPTMGIPEVGKTFNFTVAAQNQWYGMQLQMDRLFKPYNDTDCVFKRYGEGTDGGYVICENFLNTSQAIVNLGVSGYDQFGCDVTTQFPQPNYQYDCTDNRQPVCHTNNGANHFEFACTRERSQKGTQLVYSLEDLLKSRNLIKKHFILKIDIEGGEWETFRSFPRQYLDYIDQIIIEIHLDPYFAPIYWGNLHIIEALQEKFVNVNLHMNNNGCYSADYFRSIPRKFVSHAFEATLVNRKLIKINSPTRSYKLHPLNTPNSPRWDCQMAD